MPLSVGTNARNLYGIARWSMLAVLSLILFALWWPNLEGWACWLVATFGLWLLWLAWRITADETRIPGHWINVAALGAVAVLGYHLSRSALGRHMPGQDVLAGDLDLTMAVQLAAVALWVLLSQDLLSINAFPRLLPTLVGGSAAAGALLGLMRHAPEPGRLMLSLLGWAGLMLFAWPLWPEPGEITRWHRIAGRWVRLLVALLGAMLLTWQYPKSLEWLLFLAGLTSLLWAFWQAKWRWWMLLAAMACLTMVLAVRFDVRGRSPGPLWPFSLEGWIGQGERAMSRWDPWEGLSWLIGSVGWLTVTWMALGLLVGIARAMRFFRPSTPREHLRGVLWMLTAVLISTAWVAPGGLYSPAITTLFAFVWSALPQRLAEPVRLRSGWWMLGVLLVVCALVGLAHRDGILTWTTLIFGKTDSTEHFSAGLIFTFVLLWLVGRNWWSAALAMVLSLSAAAAGEISQWAISTRNAEFSDALCHAAGAGVALIVFLLCRGSRGCESKDVRPLDSRSRNTGLPGVTQE